MKKHFVAAMLPLLVTACLVGSEPRQVPLPQLPPGPLTLRVAHVVNPRLPRMDAEQLEALLAATAAAAHEHFGVELRFTKPRELPIDKLFAQIPEARRTLALDQIYDFKTGTGDRVRLQSAITAALQQTGAPLPDLLNFARPHTGPLKSSSYEALGAALTDLQLQRVGRWSAIKALDGAPAIDSQPYNEFSLWVALGYADVPYELVLTNQLIASVEYLVPAVHSAIRGGYSNGLTTYSSRSRHKAISVWSTFAITTDDAWVREMRGGESYPALEAARLAGIGATHEIGHQLFHFSHPYGQDACLMNPVPMFAYRAWSDKLSAAHCRIGSSPAMQPGAARLYY